ncbi:MAG TPA: hypothetical protein PKU78_01620, partial [Candidatus Dojkabacteria bacterium]|nr:hypothetical protein [Candidatus Dojkabacteria bacterium]
EEVKETAPSEIEPFVTPEPTTAPLEPVPGEGVDTDAMLEDAGIPEDMKKPLIIGSVATLGILTAAFGGFALYRRRQEKIRDEEFREGLGINEDQHNEIKNAIINSDLFERVSWALGSPLILSDERIYLETPQYVHIFYPSEQVVLSNKDNSSLDLNRGQIRTLFSRNLLGSGESSYDRNIRYSISFDTQDISQNEVVDREDILRRIENDVKNTNEIPEILGRLLSPELPQGIIETLKLKKGINKITDLNELRRIVGQTIIEEIDRVGDYYTFTTREIPGLEGLGIYEYVLVENFSSTPEEEPLLDLTDVVLGDSTFIVSDKFREYKEKDDIRSQLELALNQPIIGENSKVAYYYSQYSGYDAWILNGDIRIRDKDISKIISLEPEQEALLASRSYIYSNAIDGNPTFDNRDEYVNSLLAGYKNLFSDELNENDVQGLLRTVINNDVLSSDIPESVISDLSERNPDSNPDDFREKFVEVLVRKIINNEVTLQTRTIPEMPDGISAWEFVVVDAEVDQSDRNDLVAEPLISEAAVDVESEGAEYTILDITPGATVYDTYIEIRGKYNDPDMGLTSNEFSRRLPSNVLYTLRNIEKDTRGSDNITRIVLNEINRRTALWLSDDASESGNIDYENLPEAEVLELLEYAGLIIKDADTSTEDVMQIKGKLKVDREKVAGKERLTEKFNELLVIPVEQAETIMKEEPFTETESTSESGDSVELSFQNAEATKRALLHYNMRRLGELVELVGGQLDENAKDEIVSGRREVRFSPVTDERSEEKWLVEKTDLLEIIKNKREEINAVVGSEISDEEIVLDLIRGRLVYTVDETDDSKFVFKSNKIERIDDTGDLANRMPDLVKMGYVTLTNEVVDDFIDVSEDGDTTRKIADRINEGVAEGKYQLRVEEENLGGIEGWVVKVSLVEENRTDAEKRLIELASSPQDKELVGREAEDVEDLPVDNPILPIMGTETVIDTDSNTENLRAYLTTNEITLPNEEILDLVRNVIKNELQTDRTGLKRELDLIINEIMNNQDPNADTVRKNTITAISNAAKIITAQLTNNEYQQLLNKITIKLRSRLGKLDLPKQITETTAQYYILEIMYASIK